MNVDLRKAVIISSEYGIQLSRDEVGIPAAQAYINEALRFAERSGKQGSPWYAAAREKNRAWFSRNGEYYTTVYLPV